MKNWRKHLLFLAASGFTWTILAVNPVQAQTESYDYQVEIDPNIYTEGHINYVQVFFFNNGPGTGPDYALEFGVAGPGGPVCNIVSPRTRQGPGAYLAAKFRIAYSGKPVGLPVQYHLRAVTILAHHQYADTNIPNNSKQITLSFRPGGKLSCSFQMPGMPFGWQRTILQGDVTRFQLPNPCAVGLNLAEIVLLGVPGGPPGCSIRVDNGLCANCHRSGGVQPTLQNISKQAFCDVVPVFVNNPHENPNNPPSVKPPNLKAFFQDWKSRACP